MRSPKLPRISTSINPESMESRMSAPVSLSQPSPAHSRNSSGASNASTPITPSFSLRGHSRWPSSSSSLATSPDSPVNVGKSSLDDLVEEPAEIDDIAQNEVLRSSLEEFCICDTVFCKHQQAASGTFPTPPPSSPEWIPGDDRIDFAEPARSLKSQRSGDVSVVAQAPRLNRGWRSISARFNSRKATTSVSNPTVRSAPPSRSASGRQHSVKQSLASLLEPHDTKSLFSLTDKPDYNASRRPSSPTLPDPVNLYGYEDQEDPIDRKELASTPLLPPMLTELRAQQDENFQSPLQSPSVATPSTAATFADTPLSSPAPAGTYTPPLSAKPSLGSMFRVHSNSLPGVPTDAWQPGTLEPVDYLAMQLGHANFDVSPKPYMPERCDRESCNRLLFDWEEARREYMRQAWAICENYGPASQTYQLTSQKWQLIDRQWQSNIDKARAKAEAIGEKPQQDNLAQTVSASQMPSLPFDPKNPEKFPALDEGGIVGPMVQYAKVQRTPSKKKNFLKLLLEPSSFFESRR